MPIHAKGILQRSPLDLSHAKGIPLGKGSLRGGEGFPGKGKNPK